MKRFKRFSVLLFVLACLSFASCTGEPAETQETSAIDTSVLELSTPESTDETSTVSTEPENTTKTPETTKAESSAATTESEMTTVSSENTDVPICMAGAEEKPPAYELLQNEAGGYTGVLFTYEDGSTYTWECPVVSVLPPIVLFDFDNRSFAGTCLIEYATAEEALFDQVDLMHEEILYRHKNGEWRKYTYGTGGYCHENGLIKFDDDGHLVLDEQGNVIYWGPPIQEWPFDVYQKRCTGKIREIRPLKEGGTVPENPEFTTWIGNGIPPKWWEEDGVFYGKQWHRDNMPTVYRMIGYDVLYYSEEPIEYFTKEMALQLFPVIMRAEYGSWPEYDEYNLVFTQLSSGTYEFYIYHNDFFSILSSMFEKNMNVDETVNSSMMVHIRQVSPHYFVKVETYEYDDYVTYSSDIQRKAASTFLYY